MRMYAQISAAFLGLLALVQLARLLLGWPVQVDGITIPMWASVIAFVVASSFALWGFRTAKAAA